METRNDVPINPLLFPIGTPIPLAIPYTDDLSYFGKYPTIVVRIRNSDMSTTPLPLLVPNEVRDQTNRITSLIIPVTGSSGLTTENYEVLFLSNGI